MNKALPIIAIVIVVGLGIWWAMGDRSSSTSNTGTEDQTASTAETDMKKTSIQALMAAGAPVKCTYSQAMTSGTTEGTVYVSGKKMRGDFETSAGAAGSTTGHMISDGEFMYIWSDGMTQGFKMEIPEEDAEATTTTSSTAPDLSDEMDYNCGVWLPTPGSFTPPANVTFSSSLQGMMQIPTGPAN